MLSIRMQRTGRKDLAMYRMVVQDSRQTPISGKVVANLGMYNPHTKDHQIDVAKATEYLNNGAQPSRKVVLFLRSQNVEMPKWVKLNDGLERQRRNPEKLRSDQPAEEVAAEPESAETDDSQEPVKEEPAEAETEPKAEAEPAAADDKLADEKSTQE